MRNAAYLGDFEMLAIAAVLRLDADAYGVRIRQEIEERCGRVVSIGGVYMTLDRLEEREYVSSRFGEPTAVRGGRARRLFRVEAPGLRALRHSFHALNRMVEGLELGVELS